MSAYLLYDNTNDQVLFHISEGEHCHLVEKSLPDEIKNKVDELLKKGITKPKQIMHELREFPSFKKSRLTTYLQVNKKKESYLQAYNGNRCNYKACKDSR
jgi:hypothetical protein